MTNHHATTAPHAFLTHNPNPSGRHQLHLGTHPTHIAFSGHPLTGSHATIPIFFSGAVANRENLIGPFFSGYGIARTLKTPFIAISDPLVDANPTLNVAWYTGAHSSGFQTALLDLLREIITVSGKKLILIGGSAGGFAALYYALHLGAGASVLAWNPQTDITRYIPTFAQRYLTAAGAPLEITQATTWQEDAKDWASGRLDLTLPPSEQIMATDRLLVVQNKSDWHLTAHLTPWLDTAGATEMTIADEPAWVYDDNHLVIISDHGQGHATLPTEIVTFILGELLTETTSVRDALD